MSECAFESVSERTLLMELTCVRRQWRIAMIGRGVSQVGQRNVISIVRHIQRDTLRTPFVLENVRLDDITS